MSFGIFRKKMTFVLVALMAAISSIIIHYMQAGGEIFGNYFDYTNAAIYTLNFIVLLFALIFIMSNEQWHKRKYLKYPAFLILFLLWIAALIIIANVWTNAFFIHNKQYQTKVIEVAFFEDIAYCNKRIVFFKINPKDEIEFLCPNHYHIMAKRGQLTNVPKLIKDQLLDNALIKVPTKDTDKQ